MKRWSITLLLIALAAGGALAAPTPEQLAQAKEHFKKAKQLQADSKWDASIAEYQVAWDLTHIPDMVFNIGQVQRLKGDKRKAVEAYRKYLDDAPEGPGAADAQAFIVSLSHDIEIEDAAARKKAEDEAAAIRKKADEDAAARKRAEDDAAARRAKGGPEVVGPADGGPAPRRGGTLRLAGLITGGVGVVLVGVGVGFALHAGSLSDKQSNSQTEFDPGLVADGKAANRNAYLFIGLGAAAVVGGGVMWYLGHRAGAESGSAKHVSITPAVTPALAGLIASGTF